MLLRPSALPALLIALGFAPLCSGGTSAQTASDWSAPNGTAVRLLGGPKEAGTLSGGIEIRLNPGWKTYWRYPGDSGVPPRFDWTGSENVRALDIAWPAPVRFDDGGSFSIGYKEDVVIPFKVTPTDPKKPVVLKLNMEFAVCEKICQPADAVVDLELPASGDAASTELSEAVASVPHKAALGASGDPTVTAASLEGTGDDREIRVEAKVSDPGAADLFVEGPNENWALPLPTRETGPDGKTVFVLPVDGVPRDADIAKTPLRFTLVDGARAVEVEAPLSAR